LAWSATGSGVAGLVTTSKVVVEIKKILDIAVLEATGRGDNRTAFQLVDLARAISGSGGRIAGG
jgi:hypothetical protein